MNCFSKERWIAFIRRALGFWSVKVLQAQCVHALQLLASAGIHGTGTSVESYFINTTCDGDEALPLKCYSFKPICFPILNLRKCYMINELSNKFPVKVL